MDELYNWIKNIVIYMILNTIIMNLLGDSSYKKYISIVSGAILVLIVISPFMDLLHLDEKLNFFLHSNSFSVEAADFKNSLERMEEEQRESIFEEYEGRIKEQTVQILREENLSIDSFDVFFQTDTGKENFGEILTITITAKPLDEDDEGRDRIVIDRIEIGRIIIGDDEGNTSETFPSPAEINIKNKLSDFYNIGPDNINISIQGG